jgi:pimeloyl-ACP methyl ester carboxylesterase
MPTQVVPGPFAGIQFEIESYGPADGKPVVWLHSEFGSLEGPGFLSYIEADLYVIEIHHPGFGRSTGVEHFDSLTDLATGYWWLMDQLGLDQVALAGHGFGGALAAEIAVQQPQRITCLTLVSPFGLFRADEPGVDIFATTTGDVLADVYAQPTCEPATRHYPKASDGYERGLAQLRRVEVLGATSRFVYPFPDTGIVRRAYRIEPIPTEILWGAKDGVLPLSLVADWQQLLPGAHITVLPDASHMAPYEDPAATAGALNRARSSGRLAT